MTLDSTQRLGEIHRHHLVSINEFLCKLFLQNSLQKAVSFFTPDTLKSIFAMTRDRISACRIKYHMMGDIPSYLSL